MLIRKHLTSAGTIASLRYAGQPKRCTFCVGCATLHKTHITLAACAAGVMCNREIMKIFAFLSLLIPSMFIKADEFRLVHEDDNQMNKAFSRAQEGLDEFLNIAATRPKKYNAFGAYVKIEDKDETEYLWVVDVKPYDEVYYIGLVISNPRLVSNVNNGDTIGFKKEDVFDWQLKETKTEKIFGAFTVCAMLDKNNKEDMDYMEKEGFQCDFK